ncbi:vls recombination cassette Vls7, partial (plasmid) [Borreliella burgdorferi 118a]
GTEANKGAAANQASVNGIADGMKEIVDAGGGKDALKAAAAGGADDNKEAGKLFGGTAGAAGANDNDIGKAAAAVNAVSGEQILKAIVDAAGGKDTLKAADGAGGGGNNAGAGKLFGGTAGDADGAGDDDIGKAAAAVNAVSGEQILKAIVDAAAGGNKVGKAANAADNPIAAAIGTNAQGGGGAGMQNSSEKIAAAIVLRGMAKDGKFSLANQNNDRKAKVKSVVR